MESGIYQDETSGLSPEVIISEHQSSKKYLLSMLLDSPLQSHQFLLPRRHSNVIDETAVLNNGNFQLPHIATEVPSGSETSASELMQLLSQAAYMDSLVKESSKANHEHFDVITPDVEPHIQSHREGKNSAGGEFFPKKGLVMGPRCDCKLSKTSKKFHCNDVSEDDRLAMFTTFWKKMDYNQRKKFISSLVKCSFPQKRRKLTMGLARKEFAFQYHLMKNAKLLRVCKVMFLSTFNLGEFAVREWVLNKISDGGT